MDYHHYRQMTAEQIVDATLLAANKDDDFDDCTVRDSATRRRVVEAVCTLLDCVSAMARERDAANERAERAIAVVLRRDACIVALERRLKLHCPVDGIP